ncbi:hypothetical protein CLOM_g24541 [Closterium sp. NIES-68]|nr:hypothetical protein CLOM_g24541 [Closterium sp. NIES-68]GJP66076.1 hypothetical protein CLOP_g22977 [Closterium sp. NIES-67]GJP70984.1 hypothetical protein CLOP_g1876 [Closterium sp. NIES-67]
MSLSRSATVSAGLAAILFCLGASCFHGATAAKLLPENVVQGGYGPLLVKALGMNATLEYNLTQGGKPVVPDGVNATVKSASAGTASKASAEPPVFSCKINVTGKVKGKHSSLFNPWDPWTRVGLYKGKKGLYGQMINRDIKGVWSSTGFRGRIKVFTAKLQLSKANASAIAKAPADYYVQITWPPKKMSDWYFTIRGQLA